MLMHVLPCERFRFLSSKEEVKDFPEWSSPAPYHQGAASCGPETEAKLPVLEAIHPYFFLILISEAMKDRVLIPQIWFQVL